MSELIPFRFRGGTRWVVTLSLSLCLSSAVAAEPVPFDTWLTELKAEAKKRGFSEKTLAVLDTITPLPEVIEKDRHQPERKLTFEDYRRIILSDWRIGRGRDHLAENRAALDDVGAKYGVHPEFIVALWGVESAYGTKMGDFSIVSALATLAHEGRRSRFFRGELFSALKILEQGHATAETLKGSWAGAMGQCQFMPSTFLRHAADHDGDGRKDIWSTKPDVFASAAQYLSRIGWDPKAPWGQEVVVPEKLDASLWDRKLAHTMKEWRKLGLKTPGGALIEAGPRKATLVRPGGDSGPAYLVHSNYHALLSWNRSKFFATAVSLLADQLVAPTWTPRNPSDGGTPLPMSLDAGPMPSPPDAAMLGRDGGPAQPAETPRPEK